MIALLMLPTINPAWQPVAVDRIEAAIHRCLIEVGPSVWSAVKGRGWGGIPYDCGVAFSIASLMLDEKHETSLLGRLIEGNGRSTSSQYGLLDGRMKVHLMDDQPVQLWLPPLLNAITSSSRTDAKPMGTDGRIAFARALMRDVLSADCMNGNGAWPRDTYLELRGVNGCKSLKDGMRVESIDEVPNFSEPALTLRRVTERCNSSDDISIGLVGGQKLMVQGCKNRLHQRMMLSLDANRLFTSPAR